MTYVMNAAQQGIAIFTMGNNSCMCGTGSSEEYPTTGQLFPLGRA